MSPAAANGIAPASIAGAPFAGSRLAAALLVVCAAGALAALFLFDPASSRFFPPCLFHSLTGLYCPGCGTLRAFHQLAHGHVWNAFRLNPLAMLVLPFAAFELAFRKRLRPLPPAVVWGLVAVVIAFGVLRNLPFEPFRSLAPQ